MTPLGMAWRSLRQRRLASALAVFAVALGVALVATTMLLERAARDSFTRTAQGVEALIGGTKGSRIDLVLSTLYHVGRAPGRVPRTLVDDLAADSRLAYAIPVALGDRFKGLPVVGTTEEFLERFLRLKVSGGFGGEEAVVGSEAARRAGLRVGDTFVASHTGLEGDATHAHEPFRVKAIAEATGTTHDRAIYVPLETFLHLKGHHGLLRDDQEEPGVTAILAKSKSGSPLVLEPFLREINDGTEAQAVRPMQVVAELFDLIGAAQTVLGWIALLVIAVAAASICLSLLSTMAERRREVALLRALGATRARVFGAVLTESALLAGAGALLGILLGHGGAALLAPLLEARAGIRIEALTPNANELLLVLALTLLGLLAGLLPAATAYRIDVAEAL